MNVSVNGEVVHGDRLRIRILKSRCDIGNTILTFLTDAKNPEIVNLEDVPTSAVFNNTDIKVKTLFPEKITPWGYMVTLDFGWIKIDVTKLFYSGQMRVSPTLKDDESFKPSEYFGILENSWSLNGLENALDKARKACLGFV